MHNFDVTPTNYDYNKVYQSNDEYLKDFHGLESVGKALANTFIGDRNESFGSRWRPVYRSLFGGKYNWMVCEKLPPCVGTVITNSEMKKFTTLLKKDVYFCKVFCSVDLEFSIVAANSEPKHIKFVPYDKKHNYHIIKFNDGRMFMIYWDSSICDLDLAGAFEKDDREFNEELIDFVSSCRKLIKENSK